MNATLTDKLLLAEAARVEFERNIKALLGEGTDVTISVHRNNDAYIAAPSTWARDENGGTRWAVSTDATGSTAVFEAQS